eukprot:250193_1
MLTTKYGYAEFERRVRSPEEVENLIAVLPSDKSVFITGETIAIDGGRQCLVAWWGTADFGDCPAPTSPTNGNVSVTGYTPGGLATFSCAAGYENSAADEVFGCSYTIGQVDSAMLTCTHRFMSQSLRFI